MPKGDGIDISDLFGETNFFEICWCRIRNLFEDWVYPAYKLRNFLFRRYDIVRMPGIGRSEYSDVVERMLHANMELIVFFMEKEKPEEHVCWYKNESGADVGPRYGEGFDKDTLLYPEYHGRYIMDIIKEIYHWWKVDYPKLMTEKEYILSFWCKYVVGKMKSIPSNTPQYSQIVFDDKDCPKNLSSFDGKDIDWELLDKYLDGDRNNIFEDGFVRRKIDLLENEIEMKTQRYLHLCMEVREYLWT